MKMVITLFSPQSLVTGGLYTQAKAQDSLQLDFWGTFEDERDTAYCLDAPAVLPAGAMANHHNTVGCSLAHRKLLGSR